jgi:hypothetical protein
MTQFICGRMLNGEDEAASQRWFKDLSVNTPEEKHALLRQAIDETLQQQVPILRSFGILPS